MVQDECIDDMGAAMTGVWDGRVALPYVAGKHGVLRLTKPAALEYASVTRKLDELASLFDHRPVGPGQQHRLGDVQMDRSEI